MMSAPERSKRPPSSIPATAIEVVLVNPELDDVMATMLKQDRQLKAAVKSAVSFADVLVAVRPELLEEVDRVCSVRSTTRPELLALTRC